MSLATIGAPAAIASASTIPKLSPPVLGAQNTSTECSTRALSSSLTMPSMTTRSRTPASTRSSTSPASPRPAISSRRPGRCGAISSNARSRIGRPLRGSSNRPRKPSAPPGPGQPGSGSAFANLRIATPFGMRTASPPRCSTSVRRAASDTAILALIFSSADCSTGSAACSTRERGLAVWKVATIGPVAIQQASKDRLGAAGSCTCSTSKSPSRTHRRTRLADTKPNDSLATEPL